MPRNPVDVTGIVVSDQEAARRALLAVARDPNIDVIVYQSLAPERFAPDLAAQVHVSLNALAGIIKEAPVPVVLETDISTDLSDELLAALTESGLYVGRGLDLTLAALQRAAWWYRTRPGVVAATRQARGGSPTLRPPGAQPGRIWDEVESMSFLRRHGVPAVPILHAETSSAAVAAARRLGYPVALKLAAKGVAHKSELGGVVLGLGDDAAVTAAFDAVLSAATRALGAERVTGVVVAPMRAGGVELLVSVTDAGPWGTMLTVGLGGIWVEVMSDTATRLLPVDRSEVLIMLDELPRRPTPAEQPRTTGGECRRHR